MTFTQTPPADADGPDVFESDEDAPSAGPLRRLLKVVALLAFFASFGLWIYAYSGLAEREAPDLLSDSTFGPLAETVCEAATTDVAAMPNALDAVDGPDRAGQIRDATARYETMVDELDDVYDQAAAKTDADPQDLVLLADWLSDWRVILGDRYDYADRIAEDPNAQFLITDTGGTGRLDRRITRLAEINSMASCSAPGDVG